MADIILAVLFPIVALFGLLYIFIITSEKDNQAKVKKFFRELVSRFQSYVAK